MRADRPLLLILAALTAGCADPEPFVDQGDPTYTVKVSKPRDTVLDKGMVQLCFSSATPWTEVEKLARERCSAHGLQAALNRVERQQCRMTSPHRATFLCYDPEMMTEGGSPVNPFDSLAVQAWEKRTGKTAKPHNFLTTPGGPAANPAALPSTAPTPEAVPQTAPAPAQAPLATPPQAPLATPPQAPLAPLTPEGIAGRPAYQPAPLPAAPAPSAPPAEAYPPGNFSLPQGSWGDAFQE